MTRACTSSRPACRPARGALAILLILACLVVPAAATALAEGSTTEMPPIGNYCLECHVTPPATLLDEARPIDWAKDVPCPTLRKAQEQLFQNDTLVTAIQNAAAQTIAPGIDLSAQAKRLAARRFGAAAIANAEPVALNAITSQGATSRLQLNKVYTALQEARAQQQRMIILALVAAATAFVLVSLYLGWRNAAAGQGSSKRRLGSVVWPAVAALLVFGLFASPIFATAVPDAIYTDAENDRQAAVDQANAVTTAASYKSAMAWTLGSLAAQWNPVDRVQAGAVLSASVQASLDKAANADGYWGQSRAVRESAAAWPESTQDLAEYNVKRVQVFSAKAWELRAVAAEWIGQDKATAQSLLEQGLSRARQNPDSYYRDLDVRAVAVVWAGLDKVRAEALLNEVSDPMLRAWGLREIDEPARAVAAAQLVSDPYDRAWSLREIARSAPAAASAPIFAAALDAAAKVQDATARDYALADLAGVWAASDAAKAEDVIGRIDAGNHQARTVALSAAAAASGSKELFAKALAEAAKLGAPYTVDKYTAAIAADYALVDANGAAEAAGKIKDSFFRDAAYRDIGRAIAKQDPAAAKTLASEIGSAAMKVQVLSAAGALQDALALVDSAEDTSALRDLGVALAATDPAAALALLDKIDANADRAAVAMTVAMATRADKAKSAEAFARAVREAKSLRVTSEPFAAARALARLAVAYAPVSKTDAADTLALAVEAAKRVNVKY